jgi:hypothetical protein
MASSVRWPHQSPCPRGPFRKPFYLPPDPPEDVALFNYWCINIPLPARTHLMQGHSFLTDRF